MARWFAVSVLLVLGVPLAEQAMAGGFTVPERVRTAVAGVAETAIHDVCPDRTPGIRAFEPCSELRRAGMAGSARNDTNAWVALGVFLSGVVGFGVWWALATPEQRQRVITYLEESRHARDARAADRASRRQPARRQQSVRRQQARRRRHRRKLTPWHARGRHNYSKRPTGKTAVYRFYDRNGKLLYVGITNNVERRIAQHLVDKPWAHQIVRRSVEVYSSRDAALAAERRAIRRERPKYNIAHNHRWYKL